MKCGCSTSPPNLKVWLPLILVMTSLTCQLLLMNRVRKPEPRVKSPPTLTLIAPSGRYWGKFCMPSCVGVIVCVLCSKDVVRRNDPTNWLRNVGLKVYVSLMDHSPVCSTKLSPSYPGIFPPLKGVVLVL